ncbi:hypothetical protein [Streptococcus suis]
MKHDHAYSKHFKDDISPDEAYAYFHTKPIKTDEFRCDKNCSVPVILVNLRNTPDKWKVPPYFKYHKGYDNKHSIHCPNISKISKTSRRNSKRESEHSYKPSGEIIIELSSSHPTAYEEVGTLQKSLTSDKNSPSVKSDFSPASSQLRSTKLSKLSSTIHRFQTNPDMMVILNGATAPLKNFFHELRYGQYKLSTEEKIYHGKASIKLVTTKENKELYLLQFEQQCQLKNAYFERPSIFLQKETLEGTSRLQRQLKSFCETGQFFHLYFWGSFITTTQNKIRFARQQPFYNDEPFLNNLYVGKL